MTLHANDTYILNPIVVNALDVGNTLFVSKLGNDGTAQRESLLFQFLTITAAKNAAQAGDTIIVFPGAYNEGNFQKDQVNYYFHEGVIINCPPFTPFLNITTERMVIDGMAEINTDTANILTMNNNGTGNIVLRCLRARATVGSLQLNSGTTYIEFIDTYTSNYRNIYFAFNGDHYVKAKKLIQTFTAGAYSPFGTYILRCGTSAAQPFIGRAQVVAEQMIIDTANGAGGQGLMYIEAINSPGFLKVDCKQMFNRFAGFNTYSIYLANNVSNVEINGNLYCDGDASRANGIAMATPGGAAQFQYIKFNGNIYLGQGHALSTGSGYAEINGDIYKNARAITPLAPWLNDAAIYVNGNAPFAAAAYQNVKVKGKIFILTNNVNAINKAIQPNANPSYPANTELDSRLDLSGCYVYLQDKTRYCVDGPLATDPLIDNTVICSGTYTNIQTPVPPAIVEVVEAFRYDTRVGKDPATVAYNYPFIDYN